MLVPRSVDRDDALHLATLVLVMNGTLLTVVVMLVLVLLTHAH